MSKETDAQYARSVDNVAYARSRCPESKKLCPKCGSEMRFKYTSDGGMIAEREGFGIEQLSPKYVCQCGHEEKVGGDVDDNGQ